jgi:two-component system, chemotaxis family, sensor kinase CheA
VPPLYQIDELETAQPANSQPREVPSDRPNGANPSLAQDPELIADFVLESRDYLAEIENQLLTLEREGPDAEALNSVFRGYHTIKGLAGFLELWEMQTIAHEVETVLEGARNGALVIESTGFDVILESADYLARWLTHLEASHQNSQSQPPGTDDLLLARIRALCISHDAVNDDLRDEACRPPFSLAAMATAVQNPAPVGADLPASSNSATSVKVDTGKLDYLVDLAGEMVIAESLLRHDPELAALKNPRLLRRLAHLTRITTDLQKTAMSMRLVPVGQLFRRMERLVRDLSRQFGKLVEMETQGDNIELDRNIVEELADPLMHMVRNAMDHGIEMPADRERAGKNPAARLLLKAQHQAGQVVIEISDDGRGLNREKIARKAVERGAIESAEGRSDSEIYNLIFDAGFSTAAQVTNVSGRGVGMDVVRKHIESLRGRIEIRSTPGAGTSFFLKLPLTLAIIDGLVVGVGQERYVVPLFSVKEMLRPTAETVWTVQHQAEMALVRGDLLPVMRLYRLFRVKPESEDPLKSVLVIAEVEGERFCLMVDQLIGKQEVVIKGLGEVFKDVPGVAGGAILGDGRIGLILDLERLFRNGAADANL